MKPSVEVIGEYRVHPAASVFPLMDGDEFDGLVDSIAESGVLHPVIVRKTEEGPELIDGRNRLRAVLKARESGKHVELPVTWWKEDGRSVSEWIWDTNAVRRQLTPDAWAMASADIWPLIAEEAKQRKEASLKRDAGPGRGHKKNRSDENDRTVLRDHKAEDARSTVGQVASKAGVSHHKARQAIAVNKAVEAGELPPEVKKDVLAGKKKLKDVAPKPAPKPKPGPSHRTMAAIIHDLRDLIAEWKNADHNSEVLREELTTQLERI